MVLLVNEGNTRYLLSPNKLFSHSLVVFYVALDFIKLRQVVIFCALEPTSTPTTVSARKSNSVLILSKDIILDQVANENVN